MNNKISNPKTEVPKGMKLNDKGSTSKYLNGILGDDEDIAYITSVDDDIYFVKDNVLYLYILWISVQYTR